MKKTIRILALCAATVCLAASLSGCQYKSDNSDKWKTKYDISLPDFSDAGNSSKTADANGWYNTLSEDFENGLGEYFRPEQHGLRKVEYWCDEEISVKDGKVEIVARESSDHTCDGECPASGLFTGGIMTCEIVDGKRVPTFEQAFGYFEATVKFPDSDGMWSAFWLQSESMRQIGNGGADGAEIDIYESSFWKKRDKVGHCVHWDGYHDKHRAVQSIRDSGVGDLYGGYHTFALKWTPEEYVFYVDGVANWATDYGVISQVPAYIKLTNEIRPGMVGPYGQRLGDLGGGTFYIESVRVYQNVNFLPHIKSPSDFL